MPSTAKVNLVLNSAHAPQNGHDGLKLVGVVTKISLVHCPAPSYGKLFLDKPPTSLGVADPTDAPR